MTTDVDPSLNGHAADAHRRTVDALGNEFTPASLEVLEAGGITAADAVRYGVRAVRHPDHVPDAIARYWVQGDGRGPGMLFEWRDLDRTVYQFRPDKAVPDREGKLCKYASETGCGTFLNHLREPSDSDQPYLLVEGTKQGLSAAVWAPQEWGVVAVPGCDGWVGTDLMWADGRRVVVIFDGDVTTNRNVHDAAVRLKEALEAEGASEAVFAKIPGARRTDGLDDVLGRRPADKRTGYLVRIAEQAVAKLGRPPARKAASEYMTDKGLMAESASLAVLGNQPAALAAGSTVALYRGGAFRLDMGDEPLIGEVRRLLGEDYRPNWRATIKEFLVGELYQRGMRLPERMDAPLLNCANGMLDLATGTLVDHDPKYLSSRQIPVAWDPDARAPHYEAWLNDLLPHQLDDIEEVSSTMLDPSRTPQKVLFAFGPSHSGKSTFLRLLRAVAGSGNTSAVTMHQLSEDKFAAANIYGKSLNVAADLAAEHVKDTSLFKTLTGEDLVHANRKYGGQFSFTSSALFAFSANEIPTVSETTDAYTNRMKPFHWKQTFAGREDPTLEDAMYGELPGILVRWVSAWQRYTERGMYLPTLPEVRAEFDTRSDRVARWLATRCDVHPEAVGQLVGPDRGDAVSSLYVAFKAWASDDGPAGAMSRPKFSARLRSMTGVGDVRLSHRGKNLGLNVTTHTGEDRETVFVSNTGTEPDIDGVGSVGNSRSLTVGGSESKTDLDSNQSDTVKGIELPTLPTPTHTMIQDPFSGPTFVGPASDYATECDGNDRVSGGDEGGPGVPPVTTLPVPGAARRSDASVLTTGGGGAGSDVVPTLHEAPAVPVSELPNPFAGPTPAGVPVYDDFDWSL